MRPFIERHPQLTFATLARWTRDPSAHVRRLVSEGSRPRLPWGAQLKGLIADPSPTLPLLRALQDDPSAYVRRSVANHLNDIAKDHPQLIVEWLAATPARRAAAAPRAAQPRQPHADQAGRPAVLKAWGLGAPLRGEATLALSPDSAGAGRGAAADACSCAPRAARAQTLLIDYAVHHVKANGTTHAQGLQGLDAAAGGARAAHADQSAIRCAPVTTRRYHPGRHEVDLRINGAIVARAFFQLKT